MTGAKYTFSNKPISFNKYMQAERVADAVTRKYYTVGLKATEGSTMLPVGNISGIAVETIARNYKHSLFAVNGDEITEDANQLEIGYETVENALNVPLLRYIINTENHPESTFFIQAPDSGAIQFPSIVGFSKLNDPTVSYPLFWYGIEESGDATYKELTQYIKEDESIPKDWDNEILKLNWIGAVEPVIQDPINITTPFYIYEKGTDKESGMVFTAKLGATAGGQQVLPRFFTTGHSAETGGDIVIVVENEDLGVAEYNLSDYISYPHINSISRGNIRFTGTAVSGTEGFCVLLKDFVKPTQDVTRYFAIRPVIIPRLYKDADKATFESQYYMHNNGVLSEKDITTLLKDLAIRPGSKDESGSVSYMYTYLSYDATLGRHGGEYNVSFVEKRTAKSVSDIPEFTSVMPGYESYNYNGSIDLEYFVFKIIIPYDDITKFTGHKHLDSLDACQAVFLDVKDREFSHMCTIEDIFEGTDTIKYFNISKAGLYSNASDITYKDCLVFDESSIVFPFVNIRRSNSDNSFYDANTAISLTITLEDTGESITTSGVFCTEEEYNNSSYLDSEIKGACLVFDSTYIYNLLQNRDGKLVTLDITIGEGEKHASVDATKFFRQSNLTYVIPQGVLKYYDSILYSYTAPEMSKGYSLLTFFNAFPDSSTIYIDEDMFNE